MTRTSVHKCVLVTMLLVFQLSAATATAQTTGFTYQGRLTDGGTAANGNYDLQFTLWDSLAGGTQIGSTQTVPTVAVSGGIFTVTLDFGGSAFPGANRFLEIGARLSGGGAFTILSPRQQITSTPYAIRTLNATAADALSSACVACVQDSQINSVAGSKVSGTIPVAGVPSGSSNYLQNTTTPQASANFNISGSGTAGGMLSANIVNATTQYNLGNFGGGPILSAPDLTDNLFVGFLAGRSTSGFNNSFFGWAAGELNAHATGNSFFGSQAGNTNSSGGFNSYFGVNAGLANSNGERNSFFGAFTGSNNTGSNNTGIGYSVDVPGSLTNATAIGSLAQVTQSNSLVLGSIAGFNNATSSVNVGIGTTTPQNTLHVKGGTLIETTGSGGNIQFGTPNSETGMTIIKTGAGAARADLRFDASILKLVANAGTSIPAATSGIAITTSGTVGIGTAAPKHHLAVIGGPSWTSSFWNGSMEFSNASAIGWQANTAGWHFGMGQTNGGLYFFQTSSELGSTLSPVTYDMALTDGGLVGIGTTAPDNKLTVNGTADKPGGGSWDTFSDERLKNIRGRFAGGLKAVMQLQPLRYEYKRDNALGIESPGEHIGFSAQAVQKVIPEAVTKDEKGYLLVNNDPIIWTMLNAIKEQQAQIEKQQEQLKQAQVRASKQDEQIVALNTRLRTVERGLAGRSRRRQR